VSVRHFQLFKIADIAVSLILSSEIVLSEPGLFLELDGISVVHEEIIKLLIIEVLFSLAY
jgi:hypothetical protein